MVVKLGTMVVFENLPEGCIANILSLTSPLDVGRLSLVSSAFRSAADSDAVWDRFMPDDFNSIISQSSSTAAADSGSSSSAAAAASFKSKKDLYLSLSHNPLIIGDGKKSFQLVNGKNCYMLSARALFIVWGDTPRYWRWISLPEARFSEVAELVSVCWMEIRGWINTKMLSPETMYGAYLVFKPSSGGAYGFEFQSVEVFVRFAGGNAQRRDVYLDAGRERRLRYQIVARRAPAGIFNRFTRVAMEPPPPPPPPPPPQVIVDEREYPKERADGWLEMELGEFFCEGGEDREVEMAVFGFKGGDWKGGLVVQGIEIRPKP